MANRINPDRTPCEYVLIYCLQEGDVFRTHGDFTPQQYDELLAEGYFEFFGPGDGTTVIYPAFAMLCKVEKAHDFKIDEINGDRTPFKQNEPREVFFKHRR